MIEIVFDLPGDFEVRISIWTALIILFVAAAVAWGLVMFWLRSIRRRMEIHDDHA